MLSSNFERIQKLQASISNLPLLQDSIIDRETHVKTLLKDVEILSAKNVQAAAAVDRKTSLCARFEMDVKDRDGTIKELNQNIDSLNESLGLLKDKTIEFERRDKTSRDVESRMVQKASASFAFNVAGKGSGCKG